MRIKLSIRSASRLLRICLLSIFVIYAFGFPMQPVQSLMIGEGLMWSVWLSAPVKLEVCWENPSAADPLSSEADKTSGEQRREWARLAVKRTWERYARVIFVGWQQCKDEGNALPPPYTLGPRRPGVGDENLKVNITSSGASNNWGHGSWGDHEKSGVSLNLHCSGKSLKECIEYLAIHEFGHTLGFYHGEERSDWPSNIPTCPRQTHEGVIDPWWPVPKELLFGAPDTSSVMAYCSGEPTSLSPKDISGVQRAYTRRQSGTLLSVPGSLCLSAHAKNPNGDIAFGWDCDEAYEDQEWMYDRQKASLSIYWPADPQQKQRCLDVDTVSKNKVQIWDCHYGTNQQWSFRRVEIRGYGGLCLTRPTTGAGPVSMKTCSGSAAQLWRLSPGGIANSFKVKSESSNMCLVASDVAGTAVAVEPCIKTFLPMVNKFETALSSQLVEKSGELLAVGAAKTNDFRLIPGGQIGLPTSEPTPLCMDVADVLDSDYRAGKGGPMPGQMVQVFQCLNTQLNQRWNLSGDVTSGEKCLTITGSRTSNGASAVVSTCNNSIEQDWDYYW
jgi:hypothetical protein